MLIINDDFNGYILIFTGDLFDRPKVALPFEEEVGAPDSHHLGEGNQGISEIHLPHLQQTLPSHRLELLLWAVQKQTLSW